MVDMWNSALIREHDQCNDICYKACYYVKNFLECRSKNFEFNYWNLTDFLDNINPDQEIFHGGCGLFTFNGIPKSIYFAIMLLNRLGEIEVTRGNGYYVACSKAGTEYQVVLFNYCHFDFDTAGRVSIIDLRQKLKDITAQQALLLDQVLANMDDEILTAQLKTLMDEKQALQAQITSAEQSQTHSAAQASRMAELREWMAHLKVNTEYHDEQVRMAVEQITVVDAETIHIKFRYPGLEMDKKLI